MNEEINPWTIKNSQLIYENPWISLTEHQVLNPAGNPGIYGVVHYKNLALGVVAWENGHLWMVGQFRFPHGYYSWELPEGGGKPDIDPLISIQRELKEETGLTANSWELLLEMDLSNSVSDEKAMIFLARNLKSGESSPEETEQLAVKKMPFDEVYRMVESGQIRDSLTVAAVYKLKVMLLEDRLIA